MGRKPGDDLVVSLCRRHHEEQEAAPGPEWWFENVFKGLLRERYEAWKRRSG